MFSCVGELGLLGLVVVRKGFEIFWGESMSKYHIRADGNPGKCTAGRW
jgi:hypothetical protein